MKEMIYSAERIAEVLHSGEYKGYKFYIMNLGTHPTACVECKLDNCNSYDDERLEEISVHGGFTYLDRVYWNESDKTIYLGWDYAHYMDFVGYEIKFSDLWSDRENKRWTTEEIFDEVKNVIDQLKDISRERKMNAIDRYEAVDKFRSALMDKFIDLCRGNDYNKINLLLIGVTVDQIYDKCIDDMRKEGERSTEKGGVE